MEAIANFAAKSPTIFKATKVVISTLVGFMAKDTMEKLIDRAVEAGTKASVE